MVTVPVIGKSASRSIEFAEHAVTYMKNEPMRPSFHVG